MQAEYRPGADANLEDILGAEAGAHDEGYCGQRRRELNLVAGEPERCRNSRGAGGPSLEHGRRSGAHERFGDGAQRLLGCRRELAGTLQSQLVSGEPEAVNCLAVIGCALVGLPNCVPPAPSVHRSTCFRVKGCPEHLLHLLPSQAAKLGSGRQKVIDELAHSRHRYVAPESHGDPVTQLPPPRIQHRHSLPGKRGGGPRVPRAASSVSSAVDGEDHSSERADDVLDLLARRLEHWRPPIELNAPAVGTESSNRQGRRCGNGGTTN
jgi:hypothetical protein